LKEVESKHASAGKAQRWTNWIMTTTISGEEGSYWFSLAHFLLYF